MDIKTKLFKNGEVAYVRTTEEPVFVISIEGASAEKPTIVTVRRPVKDESGVRHVVDYFFADEICVYDELLEQTASRAVSDRTMELKVRQKMNEMETQPATPKVGTLLN